VKKSRNRETPASVRRDRATSRASAGPPADPPLPDYQSLAQVFVDQAHEWIAWIDSTGRLLYGNPSLCHALGYEPSEFSALYLWDVSSPETKETWAARWEEWKLGSRTLVIDLRTKHGEILPVHFIANFADLDDKEFLLCCASGSDTQLSGRLLEMQDEERRRIARDLHDTTGQNLGALRIGLSMTLAMPGVNSQIRDALEESIALADACVREIRTLSYLLHPPLLDELGLVSALRAYAAGYSDRTGIQLDLDLPPHLPRLPQAVEIALFRIVQEGLTNIHRHSGSRTAHLRLAQQPGRVELDLVDHGRGMTPGSLNGVGIAGMRERAHQLGGRLTITSPGRGTTLHVVLPLTSATV
jgi:PAS domain S-box-containing protein